MIYHIREEVPNTIFDHWKTYNPTLVWRDGRSMVMTYNSMPATLVKHMVGGLGLKIDICYLRDIEIHSSLGLVLSLLYLFIETQSHKLG